MAFEIGDTILYQRTRRRCEYLGMGKTKAPTCWVKWEDGTESTLPQDQFAVVDTAERIPSGPIYVKVLWQQIRKHKKPAIVRVPNFKKTKRERQVYSAITKSLGREPKTDYLAERIARDDRHDCIG